MTQKKRLPYFDFLRGIAIIMVVGIHTFNVNTANIASIPLRTLICCAVPLFVTLSAFFVSQKEFKDGSFFKWFINQTKKIYIPMLLWSIPYLIISIHDNTYTLRYTLFLYFLGGFSIYYFITFIIQGYLFMPILKKINIMGGVIIINLLWITAFVYLQNIRGYSFPLLYSGTPFPMWMMFFYLGIRIAQGNRLYNTKMHLCGAIIFWVIAMFATHWYVSNYGTGYGIKPSTHIMSAFLIMFLFSRNIEQWVNSHFEGNSLYKLLCKIGKDSFGIYLTHCFTIKYVMPYFNIKDWWLFSWIIVLFLTWGFCLLIKATMPKKISKYLGVF